MSRAEVKNALATDRVPRNQVGLVDIFFKFVDNRDLSASRANAVARYLISQGVSESQIVIVGYGPLEPRDSKVKERNRRVEIVPVRQ